MEQVIQLIQLGQVPVKACGVDTGTNSIKGDFQNIDINMVSACRTPHLLKYVDSFTKSPDHSAEPGCHKGWGQTGITLQSAML